MKTRKITLTKITESTTAPAVVSPLELSEQFPWPEEITKILEACRKNAYMLVNNHNKRVEYMRVGVWKHANSMDPQWFNGRVWEEYHVVVLPKDGSMCCLNEVYIDDNGTPHLSTYSIGDNVYAGFGDKKWHPERNLQEGMAAYNWLYMDKEESHGHPRSLVEGCMPMYDNRLLYAEGRHEKFYWNEDLEEVKKIRY